MTSVLSSSGSVPTSTITTTCARYEEMNSNITIGSDLLALMYYNGNETDYV